MKISELIERLQTHLAAQGDLPVQLEVYNPKASVSSDISADPVRINQQVSVYDEKVKVLNIAAFASNTRLEVEQPMVAR